MITEDIAKYMKMDGRKYSFDATLITWYQWEYTYYMGKIEPYYWKHVNVDSFKIIYDGFLDFFEKNKKKIDVCYRSLSFSHVQGKLFSEASREIQNGLTRFYSGSKLRLCAYEYFDFYFSFFEECKGDFYDKLNIPYPTFFLILLEFRNINVVDVNSFKDFYTVEHEVIIPPGKYKILSENVVDKIYRGRPIKEINYILTI